MNFSLASVFLVLAIPGVAQDSPPPPIPSYFVVAPQAQLKPNYFIFEEYGETDGLRGVVETPVIGSRGLHDLQDGPEPGGHISRGEQRWKNIHALTKATAARLGSSIHQSAPSLRDEVAVATSSPCAGNRASTVAPP